MNHYKEDDSISLCDYAKQKVVNLMHSIDQDSKSGKNECRDILGSSDTDTEVSNRESQSVIFRKVVDDYTDSNSPFAKTFFKSKNEYETEPNRYKRYAMLYRLYADGYTRRALKSDSKSKEREYKARVLFCRVAEMALRNGNSSSILERSFSDAIRSCSDKKNNRRNVFRIESRNSVYL